MPILKAKFSNNAQQQSIYYQCGKNPNIEKSFIGHRQFNMWLRLHGKTCSCTKDTDTKKFEVNPPKPNINQDGLTQMNFDVMKRYTAEVLGK